MQTILIKVNRYLPDKFTYRGLPLCVKLHPKTAEVFLKRVVLDNPLHSGKSSSSMDVTESLGSSFPSA